MSPLRTKIIDVQRRLCHESPSITVICIKALQSDANPYAEVRVRERGMKG